ncbi:MAG: DNA primase [Candidatus Uhrbacteria bacterium]
MDPKDEIKSKVDIAELVGEYLALKPAGPQRFRALCPFHSERTPSFHVSADKQIWHCFGCSEGGDCFSFVMKMEGMDFPEALRHLGKKVGVEVKRFVAAESNEKQRLVEANEVAAEFFRSTLVSSDAGKVAREYLVKRGIDVTLAEKFKLGFAPDTWDSMTFALSTRGFQPMEIERAGLALKRKDGSGVFDRFRARIMVPLRDQHGNVVGFTGRVLPGAPDDSAKYMNSPETPIYHKGHLLFGLDLAKQAIKREGRVIVVEGNLDVIASHKAGVENVVASSGTALTEDHVALLKRFTSTLVFSFDADAAGFKAAQRGIALARAASMDVRVAVLPADAGKDPDDAVQKDPQLWRDAVTKTVPIMEYFIERAVANRDLANVDDKRAVAALILPELSQITDVIEREHWLQTVSDLLRTDMGVLRSSLVNKTVMGAERQGSRHPERDISRSEDGGMPRSRGPITVGGVPSRLSKDEQAARSLLGLFLQDPESRPILILSIDDRFLPTEPLRLLYKAMREEYDSSQSTDQPAHAFFGKMRNRLQANPEDISLLTQLALHGEDFVAQSPPERVTAQIQELLDSMTASAKDRQRKAIEADMRRAEEAGDTATVEKLIREFNALR